jgi:uncharacterized protein (DUF2249 family)/hemerythrin-like domain-containing protein
MDERTPHVSGSGRPGVAGAAAGSTLAEEHALLLREVSDRAEVLLGEAVEGRWPAEQLRALVDYLHLEVLQQVVDEEWLLFRSAYHAPEELARLRREHLELRLAIDVLAQAAAGAGGLSPQQLALTTEDLLARLEKHLAAEEQVLAVAGEAPRATTSLGGRPHEWYSLIQGPVIDLDALPSGPGFDAVLERLVQMKPGEKVELRAGIDPSPMCQRLCRADPGGYGIDLLQNGPTQWRIEVTCRPAR